MTMAFTIVISMLEKSPAETKNSWNIAQIEVPIGANWTASKGQRKYCEIEEESQS